MENLNITQLDEIEVRAYNSGNAELSNAVDAIRHFINQASKIDTDIDCLSDVLTTLEKYEAKQVQLETELSEHRDFFDSCVASLGANWPGASIEDQHLQSVIYEAIQNGE